MTEPAIEPGQAFTVEYGNGHQIEVLALAGTKQMKLAKIVKKLTELENSGEGLEMFDLALSALELCFGGGDGREGEPEEQKTKRQSANAKAMELYDSKLDGELAIEIAGKTLGKQRLDEEAKKKSESLR